MAIRIQTIQTGFQGGPAYNNWYAGGQTQADADELALRVKNLWTAFGGLMKTGVEVRTTGVAEVFETITGKTTTNLAVEPLLTGGIAGAAEAAAGTCLVLRWRTGVYVNGREIRGRSYMSGLADIADGSGMVAQASLNGANAAAAGYATGSVTSVYSPTNGSTAPISAGSCWNMFGLMRSRRQ